jgi:hypothetical protein
VKLADADPAAMVIDAGTGSTVPDVRVIVAFDVGAELRLTVQLVIARDTMLAGEQAKPLSDGVADGDTVTLPVRLIPPIDAVSVAVEAAVTATAVALKFTVEDPAGIVTDAGTGSTEELDESATSVLVCAALLRATVHVVLPADKIEEGLHPIDDNTGLTPVTVMVPPVLETEIGLPVSVEPDGFATLIVAFVERLDERVTDTFATTPDGMFVVFTP